MKKRWSSDVAYGLLIATVGALVVTITLVFGLWEGLRYGLAITSLGVAVAAFGGAEYFFTRNTA